MKYLTAIFATVALIFSASAFAGSTKHCVDLEKEWGAKCNSSDSLSIMVANRCGESVYVKMCIEQKGGDWSCGTHSAVKPGEKIGGFWACHATGNYKWATCTGGYAECGFKNP